MSCAIHPYHLETFCSQETAVEEADIEAFPAIGNHTCKNILRFDSIPEFEARKSKKGKLVQFFVCMLKISNSYTNDSGRLKKNTL